MLRLALGQLIGVLALTLTVTAEPTQSGEVHFTQTQADGAKTDRNGDSLPPGALARMGSLRWRHSENVTFVAFTQDGKGVLTASRDNIVRLWDRDTGKEIRRFEAKPEAMKIIAPPARVGFNPYDGSATRVALSQDGKTLALVLSNNAIQLWDMVSGKEIRQLQPRPNGAVAIAFVPGATALAVRSFDRTVTFLNFADKEISQIKGQALDGGAVRVLLGGQGGNEATGLACSFDGKHVATGEMDVDMMQKATMYVRVSDLETGKEVRRINAPAGVSALAYSPNGKLLAFASGNAIHVCDADSGKEIHKSNQAGGISTLVFAPDSKTFATKSRDQVVRVFKADTGDKIHELGLPVMPVAPNLGGAVLFLRAGAGAGSDVRDVAYSADGKVLAVGTGQTLRFWNVETGKEQPHAGSGHRAPVTAALITPDGKTMLSRGNDGVVRRWNTKSGEELGQFTEPKGTTGAVFAPDGRTVAFANNDDSIRLHATADGKEMHSLKGHTNGIASLAFSPDSKTLASRGAGDFTIKIFDVAKGTESRQIRLPGGNPNAGGGAVVIRGGPVVGNNQAIVFSPDGQTLAINMNPGNLMIRGQAPQGEAAIRVWDVSTGKEVRQIVLPAGRTVNNIAFSPDGRVIAAENPDQTVSLWEIASGRERGFLGQAAVAAAPPDTGALVFAGRALGQANRGPLVPATLAYSPDGSVVASRGPNNSVRIWQTSTAKEIGLFKGHEAAVQGIAFAPDGKSLASASADTTLLIWDLTTLKSEARPVARLKTKDIEDLWNELGSDDAIKGVRGIAALASAPEDVVPFLRDRVKAAIPVDEKKVDQWLIDLNSSNFQKRNIATNELERLGDLAVPALKKALTSDITVETRRRIDDMLEKLTTGTLTVEQIRMVRAIESLESMATPEARKTLQSLAAGAAGALQTRHAQAALDRLGRR